MTQTALTNGMLTLTKLRIIQFSVEFMQKENDEKSNYSILHAIMQWKSNALYIL